MHPQKEKPQFFYRILQPGKLSTNDFSAYGKVAIKLYNNVQTS